MKSFTDGLSKSARKWIPLCIAGNKTSALHFPAVYWSIWTTLSPHTFWYFLPEVNNMPFFTPIYWTIMYPIYMEMSWNSYTVIMVMAHSLTQAIKIWMRHSLNVSQHSNTLIPNTNLPLMSDCIKLHLCPEKKSDRQWRILLLLSIVNIFLQNWLLVVTKINSFTSSLNNKNLHKVKTLSIVY